MASSLLAGVLGAAAMFMDAVACSQAEQEPVGILAEVVLPTPPSPGTVAVETALSRRRSIRSYAEKSLSLDQVSALAWAAQGITDSFGHRTAPSAGALYPLELYLLNSEGVFHYLPAGHKLEKLALPDQRKAISDAALGQSQVKTAPLVVVIVGLVARTRTKYGDRAERFVFLEAGHAAQNLLLEATALGLGGVPIGTFEDEEIRQALRLPSGHFPLYVLCVGHPL